MIADTLVDDDDVTLEWGDDDAMIADTFLVDDDANGDGDINQLEKILKDVEVFEELVELEATLGPAAG